MSSFHERKAERTRAFYRLRYLVKKRPCAACAGSGRYDAWGSPPCGACEGTGKEEYRDPVDEARVRKLGHAMV